MSRHLQRELDALQQRLLAQSAMIEDMIDVARRALTERAPRLLSTLHDLESQVNDQEVHIEEACLAILSRHQPVAIDLRRVTTSLKVNGDLERIGDLAINIGERAEALAEHPAFKVPTELDRMFIDSAEMVREALNAFARNDAAAARRVCLRDDDVDNANRRVIDDLSRLMSGSSQLVTAALHFFSAARHVERIADHATNIAEDVVYLVEGEIARHRHDEPAPTGRPRPEAAHDG